MQLHPSDVRGSIIRSVDRNEVVTYKVEFMQGIDDLLMCTAIVPHIPGTFGYVPFEEYEDAYIAAFIGGYAKATDKREGDFIDGVKLCELVKYIKAILYAEDLK